MDFLSFYNNIMMYLIGSIFLVGYLGTVFWGQFRVMKRSGDTEDEERRNLRIGVWVGRLLWLLVAFVFLTDNGKPYVPDLMDLPQYNAGAFSEFLGVIVKKYPDYYYEVKNSETAEIRVLVIRNMKNYQAGDEVRILCLDHSMYAVKSDGDGITDSVMPNAEHSKRALVFLYLLMLTYIFMLLVFLWHTRLTKQMYMYRRKMFLIATCLTVVTGVILLIYYLTLQGVYSRTITYMWSALWIIWYMIYLSLCLCSQCKIVFFASGKIALSDLKRFYFSDRDSVHFKKSKNAIVAEIEGYSFMIHDVIPAYLTLLQGRIID